VHERHSALVRRAPGRAPRAKVIVANVDQVLIVFACAHPAPHLRMLDRFLVLCESNSLDAVIVANKVDLVGLDAARETFGLYERIGYPVLYTSTRHPLGIEALRERLRGRISALAGPSGVGKSSLLNTVQPGLALRVASVSDAVQKGRHTTVTAQLVPLDGGGYVADTPGLRELGLWGIETDELELLFPEFTPYRGTCRFGNTCSHTHEPGCAVRGAVEAGVIPESRFESYRRMVEGEGEGETCG
jgi:ribosome biogenesis GTPase